MKIDVQKRIFEINELSASENRKYFDDHGIFCLNMISSPGSGKTTILSKTITDLKDDAEIAVIEGDIQTELDAQRIRQAGAKAIQINTHGGCHLNAEQVAGAIKKLDAADAGIIFIENVGNLVCPSAFELGEHAKVIVLSTAEGDDKPIKYPGTFAKAAAVVINKIDLIGRVDFDIERVRKDIRHLNEKCIIFEVSAKTGDGMNAWYGWLKEQLK